MDLKTTDGVTLSTIDTTAKALTTAVTEAVKNNQSSIDGATGISVYVPEVVDQNYVNTFAVASLVGINDLYTVIV